jgi:serine protease Do
MEGFNKALKAALDLHAEYPKNKAALAGKTGKPALWPVPEAIPALKDKYKPNDISRMGCVHCHNIQEGSIKSLWRSGAKVPDNMLWNYAPSTSLGLKLDPKEKAKVASVTDKSAAQAAGFKPGDSIVSLDGQPIISIADVQFVLQNAPEPGNVKTQIERDGKTMELSLPLAKGWRRVGDISYRTTTWMISNTIAGMRIKALSPDQRKTLNITDGKLAFEVAGVTPDWSKDGNGAARKAGIKKGEAIVAIDGKDDDMTESQYYAYLLQNKKPGEKLVFTFLRAGKKVDVEIPIP